MSGIGESIRENRNRLKLSMEDLSQMSGVSKSAIFKLENDQGDPRVGTLNKLCQAMEIPLLKLFAEEAGEQMMERYKRKVEEASKVTMNHLLHGKLIDSDIDPVPKQFKENVVFFRDSMRAYDFSNDKYVRPAESVNIYDWCKSDVLQIAQWITLMFEPQEKESLQNLVCSIGRFNIDNSPAATKTLTRFYYDRNGYWTVEQVDLKVPCIPMTVSQVDGCIVYKIDDIATQWASFYDKPTEDVNRPDGSFYYCLRARKGEFIVFCLKADHDLIELFIRKDDDAKLIVSLDGLALLITAGANGKLVFYGKQENDNGKRYKSLESAIGDKCFSMQMTSRVNSKLAEVNMTHHSDLMNHTEAARYLNISTDTLYKRVANNQVSREGGFMYKREMLDFYLIYQSVLEKPDEPNEE